MKNIKIDQKIIIKGTVFKVTSLNVNFDDSEHPSFLAVKYIKTRDSWSKQEHCLRYEYLSYKTTIIVK